jgi:murein DD-endopeptidase MepM/ murein hydrolase activator NlpD
MGKSAGAIINPRLMLSLVSVAVFLSAGYPLLVPAQGRRTRRYTLSEVRQNKKTVEAHLRVVKSATKQGQFRLYQIQRNRDRAEAALDTATQRWQQVQQRLAEETVRLREAQQALAGQQTAFAERLAEIHEGGEVSYLDVLLGSESFADFANQLYLAQLMVEEDTNLLRKLEDDQRRVEQIKAAVEAEEQQAASYREDAALRRAEVLRQEAAQQRELASLISDKAKYESAYAQWLALAKSLNAEIPRRARQYPVTPWTGALDPPVRGSITSGFGMRRHPILGGMRMHTGVDISARYGTPIRASGDGVVIFAGPRGGYGNAVIISHGGDVSTLYGHCSSINVAPGTKVKHGDVIARVGATGLATGPHVHFEVRVKGRPVDPMRFR